ncbi:hypothetical protein TTHERM_01135030 (macronuclear) [Tetrahymena thermophila SB210]|uniref:Uncharacterized protein n=1 Tax=Tetrahymena thermophila (strain SB210) TaxID=312017 RepID=Q235T6_TETTS|nr:hypothetical protein TTHERM_01135030 [Tetrahymena thermophila SB210]EAR92270.1 hypothetical protein TTHERM_01135030 [Tetrahymena thermophila SB210]|eukprot:XP_001012515.1 hypothetical protein TTHERM_01135030 [Tetrahymena thermophila SB210]
MNLPSNVQLESYFQGNSNQTFQKTYLLNKEDLLTQHNQIQLLNTFSDCYKKQ